MGWKKACDVSDGTWLRLVVLGVRPLMVEPATLVAPTLTLFPETPRRSCWLWLR